VCRLAHGRGRWRGAAAKAKRALFSAVFGGIQPEHVVEVREPIGCSLS